jgi:hypothetical protein
MIILF